MIDTKVPHTPRRGLMLLISSPSGAGKTSLSRRLLVDYPELTLSVSWTTRAPRSRELDGREYHFVTREKFDAMVAEGGFLEWAEVHGNCYGSPRQPVLDALASGQDVLFDIDWQGARQIHESAGPDVERIFILPPTIAELRRRLYARGQDTEAVIENPAWAANKMMISDPTIAARIDPSPEETVKIREVSQRVWTASPGPRARSSTGASTTTSWSTRTSTTPTPTSATSTTPPG